eukprot:2859139-Rhodomonas_salina.1
MVQTAIPRTPTAGDARFKPRRMDLEWYKESENGAFLSEMHASMYNGVEHVPLLRVNSISTKALERMSPSAGRDILQKQHIKTL